MLAVLRFVVGIKGEVKLKVLGASTHINKVWKDNLTKLDLNTVLESKKFR